MNESFISKESSKIQNRDRGTVSQVLRFIRELPPLRKILWIVVLLDLFAATAPQIFLWLSSTYSNCSRENSCITELPYVATHLEISYKVLAFFAAAMVIVRFLSWALFEGTGRWACQTIHSRMVDGVSRTRTTFFDENPSGRMINRLVRDFDTLQTTAVTRIGDSLGATCDVVCGGAIVMIASPIASILVLPTIILFFYVQSNISQMLQRCAVMRSIRLGELIHRETDVIEGARTFILYGHVESLVNRVSTALRDFIDLNLLRARLDGWGRLITSNVGSLYSFIALIIVTVALYNDKISEVMAGVLITVIFRLSPSFGWLGWATAYLIESAGIIRRVFEYTDLPSETIGERDSTADRPTSGNYKGLELEHYSMSYRENSPSILRDLSFKVPAGSRLGIIGRTGSGKSSLVQSLYRMVKVHSGDIRVDGISIFDQTIDAARKNFIVVPQDPYLFSGTLRSNLDRPRDRSDQELVDALSLIGVSLPLDLRINEGGTNLSFGERQLICLARAMLSQAPFIILDEPTSGIDPITDATIQRILKENLAGRTLLTIAHRLDTLRDYDYILELSNGEIKRFGPRDSFAELS